MLKRITNYFLTGGEFTNRIQYRHQVLWTKANPLQKTILTRRNSLSEWQDEEFWQRRLSNKFNAKEFALLNGCKTSDLYWHGRDIQKIDFSSLPPQYVVRPTLGHGSIGIFLMKNGVNLFDNKHYRPDELLAVLKQALNEHPAKEILIEEFLQNEDGQYEIPDDYKFFCFNGEIACIEVINRNGPHSGVCGFFDENWNRIKPVSLTYPNKVGQKKPKCFAEMVEQVKELSKLYKLFVRIDFYATAKGPVFGEFTPTPGLGRGVSKYGQKLLTNYWDRFCADQI